MRFGYQTPHNTGGDRMRRFVSGAPVRIVVIMIALIWTLPSAGLLVSSLRPPGDITSSGWWTVFAHPFEASIWTLDNYEQVLTAHGMANAFLNSILVTIPSVVIPITIAAFAAYAFAWLEFPGAEDFCSPWSSA